MHYAFLADFPKAGPLPGVRLAISTTSSLDEHAARRFADR